MVGGSRVAIIPARGGSKRIEKKNIVDFCGKPLIAWTIEAALATKLFARVVVSTDDPEIAEIGRRFEAAVPFLRKHYADDVSPVSLATIGTLQQLREECNEEFDTVAQLMPNCPLRGAEHIRDAIGHFERTNAGSQISCFKFGWMNPWWAQQIDEDGHPTPLFPEAAKMRSQDLPPLYCPTGAIWVAKTSSLLEHRSFYTPDRLFWPMPWEAAVDIDDSEDLRMATLLYHMENGVK